METKAPAPRSKKAIEASFNEFAKAYNTRPHLDPIALEAQLDGVLLLVSGISFSLFGTEIGFIVARDRKRPVDGRIFIQCCYEAPCSVTGEEKEWHGRKWYLSDHMTDDEVVKTAYAAIKATVEHEVMENFTMGGRKVFNPHTDHRALMEVGGIEIFRDPSPSEP